MATDPVNYSQITDSSGSGFAEPNLGDLLGSFSHVEDQPHFSNVNLTSRIEELQKECGFAENQQPYMVEKEHSFDENLQNQSYMAEIPDSSQEGGLMINEFPPNPSMVDGHGSFFEENAVMGNIPTLLEGNAIIEELPPNSSMIHHYALPFQETRMMDCIPTFVEWDVTVEKHMTAADMVNDHVVSSNEGHVMMVDTPQNQIAVHGGANSHEQKGALGRGPVKIRRPYLTYCKGTKHRVRWTTALHACFVRAVKQLGGCESATPKRIAALMDVPGVTRYHVKSHLQKYRNSGRSLVDSFDRNS